MKYEVLYMELVYFWINKSEKGILEKQGVLLSNQYEISFNEDDKLLSIRKNNNYYNIFKNNVITNVNAIVGSNGAGKTTILEYIYRMDVQPYIEYENNYIGQNEIEERDKKISIQIYQNEENLLIIHNIKNGIKVSKGEGYKVINVYDDKRINFENTVNLTKIYLTNSYYNYGINGYTIMSGECTDIALTMESLTTFMSGFYDKITYFPQGAIKDNWYNGLQQLLISKRKENDFQQLCDLLYFNKLLKNNMIRSFTAKVPAKLEIRIKSIIDILRQLAELDKPIRRYNSGLLYKERIKNKLRKWENVLCIKSLYTPPLFRCKFIEQLEVNLLLEMDFIYDILDENEMVSADEILSFCYKYLNGLNDENHKIEKIYYMNAIKEINRLKNILEIYADFYTIQIDYANISREYFNFCNYIGVGLEKGKSYIGKYLEIMNLEMSSGERAYLNFFSWINLLKFFKDIFSNNISDNIQKNMLLLIDEIDLYCHPEWQRKMIINLLKELKNQFPSRKIQVIFTTHSPIVLSDVPLSNTLYIRKLDNKISKIDDRLTHKETFASNIYQLFNDSFFLSGKSAIGEFALEVINETLNQIKNTNSFEENIHEIQYILNMIGEPIIRNKLMNMFKKKLIHNKTTVDKKEVPININNNENEKVLHIKKRLEELLQEIDKHIY